MPIILEKKKNQLPLGVCHTCFQKKTAFVGNSKTCWDCHQQKPLKLRSLSANFMDKEELTLWEKMSKKEKQKHLTEVKKLAKENQGSCSECQEAGLVIEAWNEETYCADCWKFHSESEKSGVNTCHRFNEQRKEEKEGFASCQTCENRSRLATYSTRRLMIETLERRDFNALTTWEDDSFLARFQELIVELKETEEFEQKRIEEVHQDLFARKLSQRKKYSKGT